MALIIIEERINCDACGPRCPNEAIYFAAEHYQIQANYVASVWDILNSRDV
tara:strand:- start:161 stop:313 length:153 start_codon:yes stop_codon:yes gene_type:complete